VGDEQQPAEGTKFPVNVDGSAGSVMGATYPTGDAGVSTGGWYLVRFMDFHVTG
jgi:hypothetical protein